MSEDQNNHHDQNSGTPAGLQSLRSVKLQASPYLASRVLTNLELPRESGRNQTSLVSFLRSRFAAMAVGLAVAAVLVYQWGAHPKIQAEAQYKVGSPYMVKVDIRELKEADIAYAEVVLDGQNIQFSSKAFADVNETKKLMISWDQLLTKQYLPVVVKGNKEGEAKVTVYFYDKNNKIVQEKQMALSFKDKAI